MGILSSKIAFAGAAAALASLSITPIGSISEKLAKKNPYFFFDDQDPKNSALLWTFRAEKFPGASCTKWKNALIEDHDGMISFKGDSLVDAKWTGFEPWTSKDRNAVLDCDSFPCPVKLDKPEAMAMKAASKAKRMEMFQSLIFFRVVSYLKTGARHPYEDGDTPVDTWSEGEARGLKSSVAVPSQAELYLRKLDFAPERIRAIRQVLDRRGSSNDREATVWVRDVYTNHYFDSWGEWATVRCEGADVVLVQVVAVELDLLKKTDLFSRISRGSMRSGVEDASHDFLDAWVKRLQQSAH